MPDPENTQPHIIAIIHNDYNQYYIVVEKNLSMQCTDIASALLYHIACYYIFNLSYHSKVYDVLQFIQEKILKVPCDETIKSCKSPVAVSHIKGITNANESLNRDSTLETDLVSD